MAQQRIGFFGQFRPEGVDQTAGAKLRSLAGLANQTQGLAVQVGTKIRRKEGAIAGAQAVETDKATGKAITPEMESDFTVFGQEFNRSATLAYQARIQLETREDLDRIQKENIADPDGFKNTVNAMKSATLKGMPPELSTIISRDIDSSVSARLSQVNAALFNRETDKQKEVIQASIESSVDELSNAVRLGETDRALTLESNLGAILNQAIDGGLISAQAAGSIKEKAKESVKKQEALKNIDDIVFSDELSLEEQFKKGSNLVESMRKKEIKNLNADQKDSLIRAVESKLAGVGRAISSVKSVNQAQIKEINRKISQDVSNLNDGKKVNEEELNQRITDAEAINESLGEYKIDVNELKREINEAKITNRFAAQSMEQRSTDEAGLIAKERSGDLSSEGIELLRSITKANDRVDRGLKSKGIEYYQEQGLGDIGAVNIIGQDGNINFQGFISDLEKRKTIVDAASAHYGQEVSPLTNKESEKFIQMYDGADSQGKGMLLAGFVDGLGDKAISALAQISKSGSGVMALSGAILSDGGDPTMIINGQTLLQEPANKNLLPTGGEAVASFDREISVRLGNAFTENPAERGAIVSATKAAYAALGAKSGDFTETVNSERLKEAINIATGGIVEYNDFKTQAPVRGMDSDGFDNLVSGLTVGDLKLQDNTLAIDDLELVVKQIKDNAKFIGVGQGQYIIQIGDGFLINTDGNEYILDLRKVIDD